MMSEFSEVLRLGAPASRGLTPKPAPRIGRPGGEPAAQRLSLQLSCALVAVALFGCATSSSVPERTPEPASVAGAPKATGFSNFGTSDDRRQLTELWNTRVHAKAFSDFPIGPGDEIVVLVPAIAELSDSTVRVSASGDINLPIIGQIHATGLTEAELTQAIKSRLLEIMYQPQFQVFVKEYQSRQFSVLGAVKRPGVFTLTGPTETVLDGISLAGGPADNAADRAVLIPASPQALLATQQFENGRDLVASPTETAYDERREMQPIRAQSLDDRLEVMPPIEPAVAQGVLPVSFTGSNGSPLMIPLRRNSASDASRFLNMPLRPGDVVYVPAGGQVSVVGWVYNPGAFQVTAGLNVLAAIGAAGGPVFAADEHDIRLRRTTTDGQTESILFDLEKIRKGEQPNIPVQGNDVIEVTYSNSKIVPYFFYSLMNSKVGGIGFAAF